MKLVAFFNARIQAQLASGLLESKGIKTFVTADDDGGQSQYPLSAGTGARIFVNEKDYIKAKKFLKSI